MLAFGVTFGTTPTGQSTYVIDNDSDVTFAVINGGSLSSTIHLGDVSSIKYRGQELLAPYSATSRYSHYEQGLGSTSNITYTIGPNDSWILVTCDDSTNGVIQYYAVRNGDNNIYMASDVTAGGEGRFLAYLSRSVFTNIEEPSNIAGNIGAVEGSDVFYLADGTTRSKFYNTRRMIENEYHGATGTTVARTTVGAWMFMGNREHSAGGPFFKDIDLQTTDGATELYNVVFSGHTQTEPYRYGMQGPYAVQITDGSAPVAPDYSWMETLGIPNLLPASERGSVSGFASGMVSGHQTVVALSNSDAQYWAIADATTGAYSIDGVQPGTYTMTMYDQELAVGTRTVTIAAQSNLLVDVTNTYYTPAATWQIGTWDGTPAGFLNADKIAIMHPSDVRMADWVDTNFVVGVSTDADWPMAQFKDVNNGQRITFNLSAAQAATAQTLRIGITLGFEGGRNRITVNAGQPGAWTSSIPAASIDLNSRGITRGTYRGPNQLYTYNIPTSALHAGVNTIDLPVVSGTPGSGFLSPNVVYDAIDLVPTASLTNAPHVQTITFSPSSATVSVGTQVDFTATARDQFGSPISANIDFSTTDGVIDQQGHFIALLAPGSATITASSSGISGMATVFVTPPNLIGDYNGDNIVGAADYTVWRNTLGASVLPYIGADGDGSGIVDENDYNTWRDHFGETYPPSALALGAAAQAAEAIIQPTAATTGPTSAVSDAALALYLAPAPAESAMPQTKASAEPAAMNLDPLLLLQLARRTSLPRQSIDQPIARQRSTTASHALRSGSALDTCRLPVLNELHDMLFGLGAVI
jgi:rhamnogalacturonan endolyase